MKFLFTKERVTVKIAIIYNNNKKSVTLAEELRKLCQKNQLVIDEKNQML